MAREGQTSAQAWHPSHRERSRVIPFSPAVSACEAQAWTQREQRMQFWADHQTSGAGRRLSGL
jgi:hypothetical protein